MFVIKLKLSAQFIAETFVATGRHIGSSCDIVIDENDPIFANEPENRAILARAIGAFPPPKETVSLQNQVYAVNAGDLILKLREREERERAADAKAAARERERAAEMQADAIDTFTRYMEQRKIVELHGAVVNRLPEVHRAQYDAECAKRRAAIEVDRAQVEAEKEELKRVALAGGFGRHAMLCVRNGYLSILDEVGAQAVCPDGMTPIPEHLADSREMGMDVSPTLEEIEKMEALANRFPNNRKGLLWDHEKQGHVPFVDIDYAGNSWRYIFK